MPRTKRVTPGGMIFHVLNRSNNGDPIFEKDDDFLAFLRVVRDALEKKPMRILSYCLMPNHWHFVLWPEHDNDLSQFMHAVTTIHVRRWRLNRRSVGYGHLYQGIFKSFPVQDDDHFYTVCRYVERNALRANLAENAKQWRWSSLWQRRQRTVPDDYPELADWPLPHLRQWLAMVNRAETEAELEALRTCVRRGRPYGSERWQQRTAERLSLQSTFRPRGRPKKKQAGKTR